MEGAVAAFVLGAAEVEETEAIRAHLAGCAGCRELAFRLRRAVAALPLSAEEARPPNRLRDERGPREARRMAPRSVSRGSGGRPPLLR